MKSSACFTKRMKKVQKEMRAQGLDLFFIEKPIDIFYYTGVRLSKGILLIDQKSGHLIVDGRYRAAAKKISSCCVLQDDQRTLFSLLAREQGSREKRIAFDSSVTSYLEYRKIEALVEKGKKRGLRFLLVEKEGFLQRMRGIKDAKEIACIKKSASLLYQGYQFLLTQLKVGMREVDLAREFEFFCRQKGAEALSFPPIIAFGTHAAYPHHRSGERRLKKGEAILFDLGVLLSGYCSDMTRVHFFGNVPQKIKEIYALVQEAAMAAIAYCAPGKKLKEVDAIARKILRLGGYEKNFTHSLGHGVGLEIHEYPRFSAPFLEDVLQPGMVITIEPGIYIEDIGGVRYEEMVLITKEGHQNLFS